jgi:hypothetical protein
MNYGIKEVKNIKIFDVKTGKEIKSETFTEKTKEEIAADVEKQMKKKMLLRKQHQRKRKEKRMP